MLAAKQWPAPRAVEAIHALSAYVNPWLGQHLHAEMAISGAPRQASPGIKPPYAVPRKVHLARESDREAQVVAGSAEPGHENGAYRSGATAGRAGRAAWAWAA